MVKEHENFKKLIANDEVSAESKNANSTLADKLLSKTAPTIDIGSKINDFNTQAKTETVDKVPEQPQFDADELLTDIPANTEEFIDDQPAPTIDIGSKINDFNTQAKTETVDKVPEQPQFDADELLTDIPANTEEFIDDQPAPTIDIGSKINDFNTQAKTESVDKVPEQPEQTFDNNEPTDIPSINNKEITEDESPDKLPKSKDSSSSKDK